MRTKLMLVGGIVTAAALAPLPSASAYCDLKFYEHTGYCNACLLVADHSQRPQPIICPL